MILAMSFSDIPFFVFQMSTFQDEAPRLINRTFDFAMCCSLTPCCLDIITVVRGSQRSLKNESLNSDLHEMMSPSALVLSIFTPDAVADHSTYSFSHIDRSLHSVQYK